MHDPRHACCVAPSQPANAPQARRAANLALTEADAKLVADDYTGAITSYNAFVSENPEHPQAARARATQKALEKLAAAQAALTRTQQGTDTTRRELSEKVAESERLRGEVAKLRADLDRLRSIDLPSRPR